MSKELDVLDGTLEVKTCQGCPFLLRSPSPGLFGCRHPHSPSVTFDSAADAPQWCPLREGPITIRLTRPRS